MFYIQADAFEPELLFGQHAPARPSALTSRKGLRDPPYAERLSYFSRILALAAPWRRRVFRGLILFLSARSESDWRQNSTRQYPLTADLSSKCAVSKR